jgi:hypothetical protein
VRRLCIAMIGVAACVLGWRGEAELSGAHDIAGVKTVHVELPSTPLAVVACVPEALPGCPEQLRWRGRVLSTGGSASDAKRHAEQVDLVFEQMGALALLRADIPLVVRGLVEIEIERIEVPDDRDLELVTDRGDLDVLGTVGSITAETGVGNVSIEGGDAGVAVLVGEGDVDVSSAGDVDVHVDEGAVSLVQVGAPRNVAITTGEGSVRVELAGSADLDLDVRADGEIRVTTDTIVALTKHELRRRTGSGEVVISIRAGGRVDIVQRD